MNRQRAQFRGKEELISLVKNQAEEQNRTMSKSKGNLHKMISDFLFLMAYAVAGFCLGYVIGRLHN